MSLACGIPLLECVYAAGCLRWACKRCLYNGEFDSASWAKATYEEFEAVPQICRTILAVYEEDLQKPLWEPPGGYRLVLNDVVRRADYDVTEGNAPPYLIYVDHAGKDIILAIRGLNLGKNKDYRTLLDNKLEQKLFDGGYVHRGLLKSAAWLLNKENDFLEELVRKYPKYTVTFAGHSLGSGVAAMMTLLVAQSSDFLGKIPKKKLRCYGVAPARCMSLNLSLKYADIMNSVILQDDFLPRTATPLQDIFGAVLCLPCMLTWRCCIDTCTSEKKKLKDPKRLYAPGRVYHIVERSYCSCGTFPPEVRTNIPVEGRFNQVVLSCNATSDHSIVEIEKEAQIALELLKESDLSVPPDQKMERKNSVVLGHKNDRKAALERAVTLNIPHAFPPEEMTEDDTDDSLSVIEDYLSEPECEESTLKEENGRRQGSRNWNDLVDKLLAKKASGGTADQREGAGNGQSSDNANWHGESSRGEQETPQKPSNWNSLLKQLFSTSKFGQNNGDEKKWPLLSS